MLWKSHNAFASYSEKHRGCFFWDTVYTKFAEIITSVIGAAVPTDVLDFRYVYTCTRICILFQNSSDSNATAVSLRCNSFHYARRLPSCTWEEMYFNHSAAYKTAAWSHCALLIEHLISLLESLRSSRWATPIYFTLQCHHISCQNWLLKLELESLLKSGRLLLDRQTLNQVESLLLRLHVSPTVYTWTHRLWYNPRWI